jgi:murein DD-endopeptidase MepM/ murein hydrolase activator NlpD
LVTTLVATIALAVPAIQDAGGAKQESKPALPTFVEPCAKYASGLRQGGNFGAYIDAKGSPFAGSWHLAEDVWLAAGTEVRAIGDGVVRYSDFSPTWTDAKGGVHWNFGNVVVIEHALQPSIDGLDAICSLYVHLASDRRVKVGDRVTRGQVIGRIGADRSEENGRYPAHLHFGIHRGPYIQIPPAFERQLRHEAASEEGLRAGDVVLRGEIEVKLNSETSVLVSSATSHASILLSLLVGSTAPRDPPPDIMCWCEGYGAKETLDEWLKPSKFLAAHAAR